MNFDLWIVMSVLIIILIDYDISMVIDNRADTFPRKINYNFFLLSV